MAEQSAFPARSEVGRNIVLGERVVKAPKVLDPRQINYAKTVT